MSARLNRQAVLYLEEFLRTSCLFFMCSIRPTFFAIVIRTDAQDGGSFLIRVSISVKCVKVCRRCRNEHLIVEKQGTGHVKLNY
jgi:hypothetical protein